MEEAEGTRTRASRARRNLAMVEAPGDESESSTMAVSIAGVSTACTKDALASSAEAVRESLSTE